MQGEQGEGKGGGDTGHGIGRQAREPGYRGLGTVWKASTGGQGQRQGRCSRSFVSQGTAPRALHMTPSVGQRAERPRGSGAIADDIPPEVSEIDPPGGAAATTTLRADGTHIGALEIPQVFYPCLPPSTPASLPGQHSPSIAYLPSPAHPPLPRSGRWDVTCPHLPCSLPQTLP